MKRNIWRRIISISFCILIGFICGMLVVNHIDLSKGVDKKGVQAIYELLILFLCIYVQIIIHEAGHLIFGLASGYKFVSFRLLSFIWIKEKEKIKFKRLSLEGTAGQCLMSPPDIVDGKFPVILYNLGGSIMNIIISIFALIIYFIIGYIPFWSTGLFTFAVIGITFAILNGIPMRMGMIDNDGYNALSLTRNNTALHSFWVQLKVNEQMAKGVRLKDMPDEWFVLPKDKEMKNSMNATIGVFACNRLIDKHKFEEANMLIAHLLEIDSGMVRIHRNLIICDYMYCELISGNYEKATILFNREQKKFMESMKKFPAVLRTEYSYVLLAEKDIIKAKNIKKYFEKCTVFYPYSSDVESERTLIDIADKYFNNNLSKEKII